jgi:hypothetical protein
LSAAIKNDPEITGIQINDSEYLLSQYADDSSLILDDNPSNVFSINDHSTVSKAFSTSINSKRPGISSSSNLSIKSYISLVHSPIYLPFKNPFCVTKPTKEEVVKCEGYLTFQECLFSLKNMKNLKSPDIDGFTVEFYKFFWNDIR